MTQSRVGSLRAVDRALYALFSRHADQPRHDRDRRRYRGADLGVGFDVFLARIYGFSVVTFVGAAIGTFMVGITLPAETINAIAHSGSAAIPMAERVTVRPIPQAYVAVSTALIVGLVTKRLTVLAGGRYLAWRARARRADIERTLPGAVRYLRALSAGNDDHRELLRKVAANRDAYGETAVAARRVLNKAALTGSLREGLELVARDTPSRELLGPFLLKFREHAEQGPDELREYLRMESRMLGHRRRRARERAGDYLELLAELFVVLLVLPALLVIVLTVMSVLAPGLDEPIVTPFGTITLRVLAVGGSAVFIISVGLVAAGLVESLRPAGLASTAYRRPSGITLLTTVSSNPASAAIISIGIPVGCALVLWTADYRWANIALLSYASYALPVGVVAVRRARLDDAKDREITDLVHAVSGHVSLGRPLGEAVDIVAREVDLGPLQADVTDLAFNAGLTTIAGDGDRRTAALERFVDRVGTPLAEQTVGLVTGALSAGSDADAVFETLQTEIGRLHHEKQALRSNLQVYVAVGWTAALLLICVMVAVNLYVLDGFARLGTVSGSTTALSPGAVDPARDRYRFYLVTQATMLACGWFAGVASRGRYEGLLHSGVLVLIAYAVFAGAGLL